jgi:hypothetical protein
LLINFFKQETHGIMKQRCTHLACGKLGRMKKPELTDMAWLGPKEEMDRASHRFGKCPECHEIIGVEKAVTDGLSTEGKTAEMLYEAFRAHVKQQPPRTPT